MDFNDRRALKAAQGPRLTPLTKRREVAKGDKERLDARIEANWGESSKVTPRKERYAAAARKGRN